ncbi:MAG: hypothetical protein HY236_05215 [Acidobacteria bacterium]|nr:hypothetical protein [Acidobacteriota bacterium]
MGRLCRLLVLLSCVPTFGAVECLCDHSAPATLESRECSLCREADRQAPDPASAFPIFFLKDTSPRKPNRTLALPIRHDKGAQDLRHLSAEQRAILWKAAIGKAQELWPDAWGLAINADTVRTQCHLHIHIGKLNEGADESNGQTIRAVEEFPVPEPGLGIWLHPMAVGFHVHTDREIAEPMLMR